MTHSLRSCFGMEELTSPTTSQKKLPDYSPARELGIRQPAPPEFAQSSAEKAEQWRASVGSGTQVPMRVGGGGREPDRCTYSNAPPPGRGWGPGTGRMTLALHCITLYSMSV